MTDAPTGPLIYIVDDDPEIGELVTELLTPLGMRIVPLTDPTAVFDLALQQRPALILLDLIMPGLDGHAVARRLREDRRTAAIPIVFVTGETASPYRTVSLALGGLAHLQKPLALATLRVAVEEALSR